MGNFSPAKESEVKWNSNNQNKLRLLLLLRYLMENTDSEHPLSTVELTEILQNEYDIDVSRNTISKDLTMLQAVGLRVDHYRSTANLWYYRGIVFDVPELKILIDAVLSSKFITQQKSEELIAKLLTQTTKNKAEQLYRHVCPDERVKSDNENGYSIVDTINEAIERQQKISFYYTDYNSYKQPYVVNDGFAYVVSPYALIWDGDYYYVRGYCDDRQAMRNFRVDRILRQPTILQQAAVPAPEEFSPAEYRRTVFRMFDTDEPVEVDLYCHRSVMKYLIDCFGRDVRIIPMQEEKPAEPDDEHDGAGETAAEEAFAEMPEPGTEGEPAGDAEPAEEAVSAVNADQPDWPEVDQSFEDVFKRKTKQAPEFFAARVTVCTSPTFFRWVFGFGGKIRITGPENAVSQYRTMLQQALREYPAGAE